MLSFVLKIILLFTILGLSYFLLKPSTRDEREPPLLKPTIPYIGHCLGLMKHGNLYLSKLLKANTAPAVTIDIIFAKYVLVTTASLLAAVQRNSKTISFEPLLTPMSERMAGINDKRSLEILESKLEPDGLNLMSRSLISLHPTLLGEGLDGMNRRMISYLKKSLDNLATYSNDKRPKHQKNQISVDIYGWIKNAITVATTDAVYGDRNPYKDPDVESGIWDWEEGLMYLLPNIMPHITARKGHLGRERCVAGFRKYMEVEPTLETTSELTWLRWKYYMVDNNIGAEAYARVEGSLAFGLLVNSVPQTFWTVFEICKRPQLLEQLRKEIIENALLDLPDSYTIDLARIKQKCPHLVSTFQETLRLRMKGSIVRMVKEDTLLDNQYLLKKGSLLQITAAHFNQSTDHWGPDANEFNSRRFMELKNVTKSRQGFLAFGCAPNTCPGRMFATGEILCLIAMLLTRFDIHPLEGEWKEPPINTTSISAAVMPPNGEIKVNIIEREEYKDRDCNFTVADGSGRFNLVIG